MKKIIFDKSIEGYTEEDIEIFEQHLDEFGQFMDHIKAIREKNPDAADRLMKNFTSASKAVIAEARVLGEKAKKPHIKIESISPVSSDAVYIQERIAGLKVYHEVKSVTREKSSAIDSEIINAESQHKSRLIEEGKDPVWHKSTIVIGVATNPWPFGSMDQLIDALEKDKAKVLQQAEYRVTRLVLGPTAPSTTRKALHKGIIELLLEAEKGSRKLSYEEIEKLAPDKRRLSSFKELEIALKSLELAAAKLQNEEELANKIEERLQKQLLVTERIRVMNPILGFEISLNRQLGGRFQAHFREEEQVEKIMHPRRHWDEAEKFRSKVIKDEKGNTALHRAAKVGKLWIIKACLDQGVEEPNIDQKTALHIAVENGHEDIVKYLIEASGAKIDEVDINGNTPLHLACEQGSFKMVELLCESGVNLSEKNKDGKTPIDIILDKRVNAVEENEEVKDIEQYLDEKIREMSQLKK